jgi:hypothetical protein
MRIDSSGNVGIGTSSPSSALDVSGGLTIDGNDNNIQHDITRQTGATNASRPVIRLIAKNTASDVTDGFGSAIQFRIKDNTAETELGAIGFIRDGGDGSGAFAVGQDSQLLQSSPQFIVDSSGRVGIGTSSPSGKLDLTSGVTTVADNSIILGYGRTLYPTDAIHRFRVSSDNLYIDADINDTISSNIIFKNDGTERMRIDSSGNLLVAKTALSVLNRGIQLEAQGVCVATNDGGLAYIANRLTNDGTLFSFRQASTEEGTISISGTTVSYNGFTGTHWSRFTDNSTPTILKGTVLETLDEMCDWYNLEFDITTTTQDEDGNDVTNTVTEKVPHVLARWSICWRYCYL